MLVLLWALMPLILCCQSYNVRTLLRSNRLIGIHLSGFDMYNLNLEGVNLSKAKLVKANLSFSNLAGAKLINADLREADLCAANLTGADLRGANLRKVDARGAVFTKANLVAAYFNDANLSGANFKDSILVVLSGAGSPSDDIKDISFYGKIMNSVHLRNADLTGTLISIKWKDFIEKQNVRNFNKIIWIK